MPTPPKTDGEAGKPSQLSPVDALTQKLAAINSPAQTGHAPYAVASLRVGVVVLVAWLLLVVGTLAISSGFRGYRGAQVAEALGYAAAIPLLILWFASLFGLVIGLVSLFQPFGKKSLAVGGCLLNGLHCLAPVVAIWF